MSDLIQHEDAVTANAENAKSATMASAATTGASSLVGDQQTYRVSPAIAGKRILMILENESFPDDTRVLLEANSLQQAGFQMTVICPTGFSKKKAEVLDGVRVYRYPKPPEIDGVIGYGLEFGYSLLVAFVYSWFVLLRHGFDAIHVHCPPDLNSMLAIFWKFLGKKFVVDLHDLSPELYDTRTDGQGSSFLRKTLLRFERLASRWADRLIATNQTQLRTQVQRGGATPEHCYVVRNGPNEMFMGNVEPDADLAADPRMKIGYVGVIGIQDGVDTMLYTLQHLKQKKRDDFLGVIVGGGPELENLKQLASELQLDHCLTFTGMVRFESVPSLIAAFDVCVTPDPSNAYNDSCTTIKTMEYMALSKPTVSFETDENRITAGDAALYATDNDTQLLADQLERLLDDPDLRTKLGQEGRRRVEESLSWDHQQKNLIKLYEDLFSSTDV